MDWRKSRSGLLVALALHRGAAKALAAGNSGATRRDGESYGGHSVSCRPPESLDCGARFPGLRSCTCARWAFRQSPMYQ
ncbi:hypothetical protein LAD54_19070 [Klebsiella pneumoniae]|nr:hypothetical protein [Klebsiella pneumoniae]